MKKKNDPTIKVGQNEEDINQSQYFDADDKISSPLATSERKKVTMPKKEEPRLKVDSDSGSKNLNMSSFSSGTINSNCSPEQLRRKQKKE